MYRLKSIKLYFFSILRLFFLRIRNFYFKSNFYNKKLISVIPERIIYNPSTYLSASLTTISSDFYKITDVAPELLWKISIKDKLKFKDISKNTSRQYFLRLNSLIKISIYIYEVDCINIFFKLDELIKI